MENMQEVRRTISFMKLKRMIQPDALADNAGVFLCLKLPNCDIILHVILLEDEPKGWVEAFLND